MLSKVVGGARAMTLRATLVRVMSAAGTGRVRTSGPTKTQELPGGRAGRQEAPLGHSFQKQRHMDSTWITPMKQQYYDLHLE
jgi:hypothetical protein